MIYNYSNHVYCLPVVVVVVVVVVAVVLIRFVFNTIHSIFTFTVCPQNLNAFKPVLKTMWFAKYAKGNNVNQYSGFEHTFVGKDILSLSP